MKTPTDHNSPAPHFVGDDLALDFINSSYGVGEARHDHFQTVQGLYDWLSAAGLPTAPLTGEEPDTLLASARVLRDNARDLVALRKRGEHGNAEPLNTVLAQSSAYRQLDWSTGEAPALIDRQRADGPVAALLPVAEAIASLLVKADFNLVRQCESDDCTLWFHDRTKSHHRRWCSQAMCGNRMKVAAFRARKRG
ncbi:MAG: ABATE domain-containing protein [Luteibacter sp.]|uniref:CGNR zinc finger domain-containing protein n=1 Tax=Luteibacter sp. TaxID=1886636 RepID=UPI0028073DB6|nr:ABATE domain-containing protein [Luteibacter sp.]MDQ7997936.1 ABATE domain-containing protein [Luteibacter sp.]MDQ8050106.1 ABATE domain-containing protein [Luteibacter sp.]